MCKSFVLICDVVQIFHGYQFNDYIHFQILILVSPWHADTIPGPPSSRPRAACTRWSTLWRLSGTPEHVWVGFQFLLMSLHLFCIREAKKMLLILHFSPNFVTKMLNDSELLEMDLKHDLKKCSILKNLLGNNI